MAKGWIKINRSIVDHWIFKDAEYLKAWIWLIAKASHKEQTFMSKGQVVHLMPGQLITSIAEMQNAWGWKSKNKVVRFIGVLVGDGMCTKHGTPNGTTLTIVNYGKYQVSRYTNEPTNGYADGYTDGYTDGPLTRMIKNKRKEEGSSPHVLSYAEERARQMKMVDEWVPEELRGDTDEV